MQETHVANPVGKAPPSWGQDMTAAGNGAAAPDSCVQTARTGSYVLIFTVQMLVTACECLSALHRQGVCVCVHLFFITSKRWSSYQACSVQSGLMMPLLLQAVRATSLESWPSENAKYADFGPVRRPNFRLHPQETALARTRACYSQALAGFELQNCGVRWMALASRHEERKMADDILLWEKIRLQPLCGTQRQCRNTAEQNIK